MSKNMHAIKFRIHTTNEVCLRRTSPPPVYHSSFCGSSFSLDHLYSPPRAKNISSSKPAHAPNARDRCQDRAHSPPTEPRINTCVCEFELHRRNRSHRAPRRRVSSWRALWRRRCSRGIACTRRGSGSCCASCRCSPARGSGWWRTIAVGFWFV